jgi:hypothetical protein
MEGWKTKYGGIISALAGLFLSASELMPPGYDEYVVWCKFIAGMLGSIGVPLAVIGVGHKLDKIKEDK